MANALTTLRLLLVAPFIVCMARGDNRSAVIALAIWTVALATDIFDGPIARRRGTVSAMSRAFDHTSDFLFVTGGITAGAWRGDIPWVLPVFITAAFIQYVIDSRWMQPKSGLRGNKLGRYNGMLYFLPPCADALTRVGAVFLRPVLTALVWLLVLSTIASMIQRLSYWRLSEHLSRSTPQK